MRARRPSGSGGAEEISGPKAVATGASVRACVAPPRLLWQGTHQLRVAMLSRSWCLPPATSCAVHTTLAPLRIASRGFKTAKKEQAKKLAKEAAAKAATQGRDPYGLFKMALVSEPVAGAEKQVEGPSGGWRQYNAEYSRIKMAEHNRCLLYTSPSPRDS